MPIFIPLGELVDFEKEVARLEKELKNTESEIARAQGMLANKNFVQRAPKALIDKEKEKLEKFNGLREKILAQINNLK